MKYEEANNQLTGRNQNGRKLANNTYLERRGDNIALRLHSTDIITFQPDGIVLVTTGGWKTVTTKARLNEYLPHGFGISQKGGVWYWWQNANANQNLKPGTVFSDGDKITRKGEIRAQAKPSASEKQLRERARVNAYAKLYTVNGPLDLPGAGDCFYCQLETQSGQSLGDAMKSHEHIRLHIKEKYVVPSLAFHALKEANCGQLVIQACFKNPAEKPSEYLGRLQKTYLPRAVRKYVLRRLGMAA